MRLFYRRYSTEWWSFVTFSLIHERFTVFSSSMRVVLSWGRPALSLSVAIRVVLTGSTSSPLTLLEENCLVGTLGESPRRTREGDSGFYPRAALIGRSPQRAP